MESKGTPPPCENDKSATAASPDPLVTAVNVRLEERREATLESPTDDKLVEVWNQWHQLPTDLLPEEKGTLLLSDNPPKVLFVKPAAPELRAIKDRVGTLDPSFSTTIDRAILWNRQCDFHASNQKHYEQRIQQEWIWDWPVNPAVSRLAIFRAFRELDVSDPGLTSKRRPSLAEIALLEDRFQAYRCAREHGLRILRDRLDRLIPKGEPVEFERRAPPMWTDRSDVLREYMLAAMRCLNLIPEERLRSEDSLLAAKRSHNEKLRFRAIRESKRPLRSNSIMLFQIWLIDNRPLIKRFQLSKAALSVHAIRQKIPIKGDESDVSKWELGFKFKRGRAPARWVRVHRRLLELLSPRPLFAGISEVPPKIPK